MAAPDARLRVVAAESPWGKVAAAIGGPDAVVRSLVAAPSVDPHEYQPDASAAAAVARAQVVVENGLGYDGFMDRLLATGAVGPRRTVVAAKALGVEGTDANPHLWYALEEVPRVAAAIERSMEAADPARRAGYRRRLEAFDASLQPLLGTLRAIRATRGGSPVAETERVAGDLLHEAGLEVISPLGLALAVESGREPAAADAQRAAEQLSNAQVRLLVVNAQAPTPTSASLVGLARSKGIGVLEVTETVQPPSSSFVGWQGRQLEALGRSLGGAA